MHVVEKKLNGKTYIYIQETVYSKETKKSRSRHIAYLGPKKKLSDATISAALTYYNTMKEDNQE